MKLDVDFTDLALSAAKIRGLDEYCIALRKANKSYSEGLDLAKSYALDNGGEIAVTDNDGVTAISVLGEEVKCFQPYPDINKFYFES